MTLAILTYHSRKAKLQQKNKRLRADNIYKTKLATTNGNIVKKEEEKGEHKEKREGEEGEGRGQERSRRKNKKKRKRIFALNSF